MEKILPFVIWGESLILEMYIKSYDQVLNTDVF